MNSECVDAGLSILSKKIQVNIESIIYSPILKNLIYVLFSQEFGYNIDVYNTHDLRLISAGVQSVQAAVGRDFIGILPRDSAVQERVDVNILDSTFPPSSKNI